ncbi:uncharacterized protein LOC125947201 [Dermacentor silvarum]|uniref:uncharacterized protein LOC125947201 n=1 Tax=Dermacentor silvarum TaxID=543639 RepID=UPI002100EE3A|nr:uncharacterized protein LOC125947201 [Dermacentor silvarum]
METLSKTSKKVFDYGANSPLPLLEKLDVLISYKESSSHETLYVVSGDCVQPDPTKVSAVIGASPPTSASEVKSLLYLVNYCGRFIPNLAHLTQPLRKLTAKGEHWCWTEIQQDALYELKRQISEATALAYFDPGTDITFIVDAAPHGLGAILTQTSGSETRVVAYRSHALSPVKARYSQIEREMLAVVWGIEHFHIYLYGTAFHLLTDHKPLVSILSNPRSLPSARLERLALRIQQYTFEVEHTSGPSNPSHYLSHHPVNSTEPFRRMESVTEQYVNFIVSHSLPRAMTIKESEGFAEFASELGFKHHRITPQWPEANGEAERFMRTLTKSTLASRVSHLEWTNELQSFLLAYRSTLHGSTGKSPYELLFGRPTKNLPPTIATDTQNSAPSEARQNDTQRKAYIKQYVDSHRHTSHNQLHVGQQVLCKQDRSNKFSSYYDPHPYTITKVTGSKITASRDGVSICRNSSFFKDASTVQMERHQDQTDIPDVDDAAVPSNSDLPSHSTATPSEAQPATPKSASQRYPQRTRQRRERLKDYV